MVDLGTILVVDDNAENRALAAATLEDEGYRVVVAGDGEQAVVAAKAERPDCVLMDIRMPKLDGIAACERIRDLPRGDQIAVIFVTAQREVEAFDRALAAGGDDFMTKPFRPSELVVRVQTALRLRRHSRERTELYELLKHQRDMLQRLELQKEQLVTFLVHDLKNPVNAIDLHALVVERSAVDDHERARTSAAKIREETRALLRMITNLLDISKADAGRLAPAMAEVEAASLVRDVIDELTVAAGRVAVTITAEVNGTTIRGDRDLLARVLANLVDNAIRHSPEGSQICVQIADVDQRTEIRVVDRGPGIPPQQHAEVFERFLSGGNTTRSNRGLGLAFCKLAVEAHGGQIWIEDASPGAVFCVRI